PAERRGHWHPGRQLGEKVNRDERGEEPPPEAHRREQERREQDRVRRPEHGDRLIPRRQKKADSRAREVTEGNDQNRRGVPELMSGACRHLATGKSATFRRSSPDPCPGGWPASPTGAVRKPPAARY